MSPSKALTPEAAPPGSAEIRELWCSARQIFPVYAALSKLFAFPEAPYGCFPENPGAGALENVLRWLDQMDQEVQAFQLRQVLSASTGLGESTLRALILHHLKKHKKGPFDRDKVDFLLGQYFAMCAAEGTYHKGIGLEDVAEVLQRVLGPAEIVRLEWCEPLDQMLAALPQFTSLRDLLESGYLERARLIKQSAGGMFYDPAALVAFTRFNFVLRREFFRLLHADLQGLEHALNELQLAGVKAVDCRRAGLSAAESTAALLQVCRHWKLPSQKDYNEHSVARAFEQLLAIRVDAEEALMRLRQPQAMLEPSAEAKRSDAAQAPAAKMPAEPREVSGSVAGTSAAALKAPNVSIAATGKASGAAVHTSTASRGNPPEVTHKPRRSASAGKTTAAKDRPELEDCLEKIWEQLIAVSPVRGRSMSTVLLNDTKILLSSWEVAAFLSDGGQVSADLRTAVSARALVATAMDRYKNSADSGALESALEVARAEISYLQNRVEEAKRAKNTDAAVNLGITAKRLMSFIDEAEGLRS